ncbi:MAG: hypothetical protein C0407_12320 [Desulfobacca sp.]|nr:hypothetical protein [Desulfobacca sp.]
MRTLIRIILIGLFPLILWGCTTSKIIDLAYAPGKVLPILSGGVKVAVIPFEDITWNGQETPNWVGQANLYGIQLQSPNTVSYLVTRGVKNEMAAYGYQLSTDEIYSIQVNRNDIKTLLRKIPHIQVDYLVGGTINHFFVQQVGRFIAEVEIEAYLIRPPLGEIVWIKKIGHREVRIPYPPEDFSTESQQILNNLLEKTLKDLFRNSDFRIQTLSDRKE